MFPSSTLDLVHTSIGPISHYLMIFSAAAFFAALALSAIPDWRERYGTPLFRIDSLDDFGPLLGNFVLVIVNSWFTFAMLTDQGFNYDDQYNLFRNYSGINAVEFFLTITGILFFWVWSFGNHVMHWWKPRFSIRNLRFSLLIIAVIQLFLIFPILWFFLEAILWILDLARELSSSNTGFFTSITLSLWLLFCSLAMTAAVVALCGLGLLHFIKITKHHLDCLRMCSLSYETIDYPKPSDEISFALLPDILTKSFGWRDEYFPDDRSLEYLNGKLTISRQISRLVGSHETNVKNIFRNGTCFRINHHLMSFQKQDDFFTQFDEWPSQNQEELFNARKHFSEAYLFFKRNLKELKNFLIHDNFYGDVVFKIIKNDGEFVTAVRFDREFGLMWGDELEIPILALIKPNCIFFSKPEIQHGPKLLQKLGWVFPIPRATLLVKRLWISQ